MLLTLLLMCNLLLTFIIKILREFQIILIQFIFYSSPYHIILKNIIVFLPSLQCDLQHALNLWYYMNTSQIMSLKLFHSSSECVNLQCPRQVTVSNGTSLGDLVGKSNSNSDSNPLNNSPFF